MKLYKLTDANGRTYGGLQWGEGITHEAQGSADQELCFDGWIHAYEHPLLAVLLNPIGANFQNPQLWEAEGEIGKRERQLKCGCRKLTTIRRMELPAVTVAQRVRFAILCAQAVCKDEKWGVWADRWLSGEDRSAAGAAAAWAAWAAAGAAWAAAAGAAWAAAWAAGAAEAGARAAAAGAARAEAAAAAAEAAAAAAAAAGARPQLDLILIAERAIAEESTKAKVTP